MPERFGGSAEKTAARTASKAKSGRIQQVEENTRFITRQEFRRVSQLSSVNCENLVLKF